MDKLSNTLADLTLTDNPKGTPKARPKARPKSVPKAQSKAQLKARPKSEPKTQLKAQLKARPKSKGKGKAKGKGKGKGKGKAQLAQLKRPTFYFNGDKSKPIRAGGVLLYKRVEDTTKFLFIYDVDKKRYEDFGGKSDPDDATYQIMCAREAEEESNGIFQQDNLISRMVDGTYISCKYVVFLIETDVDYNPADFGEYELHENHHRTVHWIDFKTVTKSSWYKKNLHIRLREKAFFETIIELDKSHKKLDSN